MSVECWSVERVVVLPVAQSVQFLAAQGDHDAQMQMSRLMVEAGADGDLPLEGAICMAMLWAEMAATSGKAEHLFAYAGLLMAQASRAPDDAVAGEYDDAFAVALAIIDVAADMGHSRAEFLSFAVATRVGPDVVAKAMALKPQFQMQPLTDAEMQGDDEWVRSIAAALQEDTVGSC